MRLTSSTAKRVSVGLGLVLLLTLSGCSLSGRPSDEFSPPSGSRSALPVIDTLVQTSAFAGVRNSSLLGIYVSQYLALTSGSATVHGALDAVTALSQLMTVAQSASDPDFQLLQAFADALSVDVADLLNRSENRSEALSSYETALTNVAEHANQRFKELTDAAKTLKDEARTLKREQDTTDRSLKTALKDKDFTTASELQKQLEEKQVAATAALQKQTQTENVVKSLDSLLTLYGEKILALKKNREAIITGIKIIDVPGIEDLQLIERQKAPTRKRGTFDSLFLL